jgi:predicted DNA-binding transcriptional regulator AlpA
MKHSESKSAQVRKLMVENPKLSAKEITAQTGIPIATVYNAMSKTRKKVKKPKVISKHERYVREKNAQADALYRATLGRGRPRMMTTFMTSDSPMSDMVNHPAHYKVGGIETIDFIEAKKLSYNLGNVVKYITRADHKGDRKEDLQKAQWYLNRELKNLEK